MGYYAQIAQAIGAATAAGMNQYAENKNLGMYADAWGNYGQGLPMAPSLKGEWMQGWNLGNALTDDQVYRDAALRSQVGKTNAKNAAEVYSSLLPSLARVNFNTLKRIDPESVEGRKQLYGNVRDDLALKYGLDPDYQRELEQSVRG